MRLFLAIPLPKDLASKLADYQGKLNLKDHGRFIPRRNFHVTVFFLGELPQGRLSELKKKVKEAANNLSSFELSFEKVESRPPKMIWARFAISPEWQKFWQAISKVAKGFAEKVERNRQIPHVTLARVKSFPRGLKLSKLALKNLKVNAFELWQSHLGDKGAFYKSLEKFPLIKPNSFTEKVRSVVRKIPKGKVLTYAEVARRAGSPGAVRAVGNILTKNRDPEVPCHRVVRSDGGVGGFFWGTAKKVEILKKEGVNINKEKII